MLGRCCSVTPCALELDGSRVVKSVRPTLIQPLSPRTRLQGRRKRVPVSMNNTRTNDIVVSLASLMPRGSRRKVAFVFPTHIFSSHQIRYQKPQKPKKPRSLLTSLGILLTGNDQDQDQPSSSNLSSLLLYHHFPSLLLFARKNLKSFNFSLAKAIQICLLT